MKHAKFTITRQVKSGITYYTLSIPAYLTPTEHTLTAIHRTEQLIAELRALNL